MSYTSNISHSFCRKVESPFIDPISHIPPNEKLSSEITELEFPNSFIPGGFKEDSPRDRLFFHLYKVGKINAFGDCISSENWEAPNLLTENGFQEIKEYLTREIEIICRDAFNKTFSTTITLMSLLRHINKVTKSDIFFFGSHLQEIVSRCHFGLNNLKKIVKDPNYLNFLENSEPLKSGDSDWRVFPKGIINSQDILNLTQDVINFIASSIYKSLDSPQLKLYEIAKYVKATSLLKLCFFDSSQHNMSLEREKKTTYTTISFGDKDNQPIDLMFIKEIENPCLFNLDDLKMNIHDLLIANATKKEMRLQSSASSNTWQQIIDHSLFILHCPTLKTCDEMGWLRALRHMTKGGRFFQEGIDLALFKKINPEKLPDMIFKYFKKIESPDQTGIKALYFHILIFLKQNSINEKLIEDIQKKIEAEFLKSSENKNLFEYINKALKESSLSFEIIYSHLHFMLFLNMAANSEKVTISRNGVKPVFEISDVYFLQTSGPLSSAIKNLSTLKSLPQNALDILEGISTYLMPTVDYTSTPNESLKARLHYFDLEFKQVPKMALKLLKTENYLIQKHGYNLLILSICYTTCPKESYLLLFQYYPHIIQNELTQDEQIRIRKRIFNLLEKTSLNSLKGVFVNTNNINSSDYFSLFIFNMDYSSSSFVVDLWYHLGVEMPEKKASGILLLEKIANYDLTISLKLFMHLLAYFGLTQNEKIFLLKKLCFSNEKKMNIQNLLNFAQVATLVILSEEQPLDPLKAVENELITIIKKLVLSDLKIEAKKLLTLGMDRFIISLHTAASIGLFKEFLSPSVIFQDSLVFLKQEISGRNFQKAIILLREILILEKTDEESSLLRSTIYDLFHDFSKESNFSAIYSLLFVDSFQKFYSSHFDEKCHLYCLYLESGENKNIETFKILGLLLSYFEDASLISCSSSNSLKLFKFVLQTLKDFHIELQPSFKNLIVEKTPQILKFLSHYEQHELMIDLLTTMHNRKLKMTFDEEKIEMIIKATKTELINNRFIENIYQLFLTLKLYQFTLSPHATDIRETHNLLMEKLLNLNLAKLSKNMLGLLLKSEVPNVQSLTVWANIFSQKEKCFDTYTFLIENLLSYLETSQNDDSLCNTITLFIESDQRSFNDKYHENLYLNFKVILICVHKFISCKTRTNVLRGFNIFQNSINSELLKIDIVHKVHQDIEKTMLLMIANLNKLSFEEKDELPEMFGSIYLRLHSDHPEIFKILNHVNLIEIMLKSPDYSMLITSGQIFYFLIEPLKKQADQHLIASALKYFQKALNPIQYFKQENQYKTLSKMILWKFSHLNTFDLHFNMSTKAEIMGKVIYFGLTELKDFSNYKALEDIFSDLIKSLPILMHHPETELLCIGQALNILISSVIQGNKHFFISHYLKLLHGIVKDADFLLLHPYRYFNIFTLLINKFFEVKDINEDYTLIILTSIQQNIFVLLADLATYKIELKSEHFEILAEICKKKRQALVEVLEKLIFFPPAQSSFYFNSHLEQLERIYKEAKELNVFQEKPNLKNLIDFYINLNPQCLLESTGQIRAQFAVSETVSMINRLVSFNSPILVLRAIGVYSYAQKIIIAFKGQNKQRAFLEPHNFLICFKKIQESILLNPFFKSLIYDTDETDEGMNKPYEKENFIFYQFQYSILENPHFLNINRSKEWENTFLEVSTAWCKTLIQLHQTATTDELKNLLLGSVCEFMDICNRLNCFSGHFNHYHLILKQFIPLLIQHIDFLKANQNALELYLKAHDLMNLFQINSSLSKSEHAILAKFGSTVLQEIMKIEHSMAKTYVEKQLVLGQKLKIFNATDLKKLRELL